MNNIDKQRLILDSELYVSLKNLGIVANQFEFSKLLGRSDSYFSSMKSLGRSIAPGSLLKLKSNLHNKIRAGGINERSSQLAVVSRFVDSLVMDRIA